MTPPRRPSPDLDEDENTEEDQTLPGSAPLSNHKWELFVLNMMRGQGVNLAYENAGFTPSPGNASRLKGRHEVRDRLTFMTLQAAKDSVVDAEWVRRKLTLLVDLTLATELQQDGSIKPTATTNFSAANRALELLGRDYGMFKERIELGGHVQVANSDLFRKLTGDERAAMRAMLVEAAARQVAANQNDDEQAGVVPALPAK